MDLRETRTATERAVDGARLRTTHDNNLRELAELLSRRTELKGLNATADHMVEALTWAV